MSKAAQQISKGNTIIRFCDNKPVHPFGNGTIHHWAGIAFIPRATLQEVLCVLPDYDHHAQYYAPDVECSKIESHDGEHFLAFLRFRRHKVIAVVLARDIPAD